VDKCVGSRVSERKLFIYAARRPAKTKNVTRYFPAFPTLAFILFYPI